MSFNFALLDNDNYNNIYANNDNINNNDNNIEENNNNINNNIATSSSSPPRIGIRNNTRSNQSQQQSSPQLQSTINIPTTAATTTSSNNVRRPKKLRQPKNYDEEKPFKKDKVGYEVSLRVDDKTGAIYTKSYDSDVVISTKDDPTIDRKRGERITKSTMDIYEDPYLDHEKVLFETTREEQEQFKTVLSEYVMKTPMVKSTRIFKDTESVTSESLALEEIEEEQDDDNNNNVSATIHLNNTSNKDISSNSMEIDESVPKKNKKVIKKPATDEDEFIILATEEQQKMLFQTGENDNKIKDGSSSVNVDQDPLAIFLKNEGFCILIQNHIYIVEVMIHLKPLQDVILDNRRFYTYESMFEELSKSGMIMDAPSLENSLGFDVTDIDDTSFQYSHEEGTIVISFRFVDEVKGETAALMSASNIMRPEERISLTKITDAELTALIEDRIYVKVVLLVHNDDKMELNKILKDKIKFDGSHVKELKKQRVLRDTLIKNIRVVFGFFFFATR